MLNRVFTAAAAAFLVSVPLSAHAQDVLSPERFSLGAGVGTNGGLIEGAYKLTPQIVLRGQGAFLDFDHDFSSSDVEYHGRLKFDTGGGFLDLHPFTNPWLLSAGAVGGNRKVSVTASPAVTGSIRINGVFYPVTEVGSVKGAIDFGSPAPFVGVGWDNTYYHAGRIGFRAVAGVVFGDKPDVALSAVGPFAANPAVLSNLAAESASLQRDAEDYRYYPIVQLGLNYRF